MKLVELLGLQPILNLLPMRYLQADEILFVGTKETHDISRHLQSLMQDRAKIHLTELRLPHDPFEVHKAIAKKLRKLGWEGKDVVFDLSDGTKAECFGVVRLAKEMVSPVIDVELIHGRYRLRRFVPEGDHLVFDSDNALPDLIDIGDYFHAHLPGYEVGGAASDERGHVDIGGRFEETGRRIRPDRDRSGCTARQSRGDRGGQDGGKEGGDRSVKYGRESTVHR